MCRRISGLCDDTNCKKTLGGNTGFEEREEDGADWRLFTLSATDELE
jgi:hypothetical protein